MDTVLAGLTDSNGAPADLSRLDDVLRSALAWTAAAGDTCRVPHAVRQVRDARVSLGQDDPDHARTVLLAAREDLSVMPSQRALH